MPDAEPAAERLPLSAMVSQLLVAFTIEFDNDNWLGTLEQHRYLSLGPDPAGSRYKVATLTPKGIRVRDAYHRWASTIEDLWAERFSAQPVHELRNSAERLVTGPGEGSALWRGIEPCPDGWRAQVTRPRTLPHYPVVSHRGGFPDGS